MSKTKVMTRKPSMITAFHKILITVIIVASPCTTIHVILEIKKTTNQINNSMYLNMLTELWSSEK